MTLEANENGAIARPATASTPRQGWFRKNRGAILRHAIQERPIVLQRHFLPM